MELTENSFVLKMILSWENFLKDVVRKPNELLLFLFIIGLIFNNRNKEKLMVMSPSRYQRRYSVVLWV